MNEVILLLMNEVLQANIFFIITSIAVVVFTILICVALYQVIGILRSVRHMVNRVEEGSEAIAEGVSNLGKSLADATLLKAIIKGLFGIRDFEEKKPTRRKPRAKKIAVQEEDKEVI